MNLPNINDWYVPAINVKAIKAQKTTIELFYSLPIFLKSKSVYKYSSDRELT